MFRNRNSNCHLLNFYHEAGPAPSASWTVLLFLQDRYNYVHFIDKETELSEVNDLIKGHMVSQWNWDLKAHSTLC